MVITPTALTVDELHSLTRKQRVVGSHDTLTDLQTTRELWSQLVETVHRPAVSDSHMTAVCNAICFVLRNSANSHAEGLRMHAYSQETWRETFSAARCAFACGKSKPAIQILETIQYLSETNSFSDVNVMSENVEDAAVEMARIIFSHHPRRSLKEACTVLYFFLRRLSSFMSFSGVLDRAFQCESAAFSRLCRASSMSLTTLNDAAQPQWFAFVVALLFAVRIADSKSATLKLLSLLCGLPASTYQTDLPSFLSKSIDLYSTVDETALEVVVRDVLPSILTDRNSYMAFLLKQCELGTPGTPTVLVMLGLLQHGKNRGFIAESDLPDAVGEYCLRHELSGVPDHPFEPFTWLLCHSSAAVRLRTCDLLVSSKSSTTPFPLGALNCLADNLTYLHDETDAFHRGEIFSIFRRVLLRILQSRRTLENTETAGTSRTVLHEYDRFYQFYIPFLTSEISAGNSYPRHILALLLLDFTSSTSVPSGNSLTESLLSNRDLLTNLFHLILDPYEDVRILASRVLFRAGKLHSQIFRDIINTITPLETTSILAAATNRADHADAFGHMLSLVSQGTVSSQVPMANRAEQLSLELLAHVCDLPKFDISWSVPLHGMILGIRYMVEACTKDRTTLSPSLIDTCLDICRRTWLLSQPHLCIDSPEMESEPAEDTDSGPKDLLAYSWRALRDSNLLMQAMLGNLAANLDLLQRVGDTCLDQLALLRHRGAFSTVAQTFTLCCQQSHTSTTPETKILADLWFSKALIELEKQADKLTRRSAGLPAIFQAVFNPGDERKFSEYFQALVGKAEEKPPPVKPGRTEGNLRLPQVHALNCIKEVMTSSRFRVMTEPLVVFTLNLAANCMGSGIWAIKNCGLMLLRASINRLDPDTGLGDAEAGMRPRTSSSTDRRAIDVAADFLSQGTGKSSPETESPPTKVDRALSISAEAEFAGLDIIGRLYIRENERERIQDLVTAKLEHPLWHVRAQAARTLVILIPQGVEFLTIRNILSQSLSTDRISLNRLHGSLMLAENVVQRLQVTSDLLTHKAEIADVLVQLTRSRAILSSSSLIARWLALANRLLEKCNADVESPSILYDVFEQSISSSEAYADRHETLHLREAAVFQLRCYTLFGKGHRRTVSEFRECNDDILSHAMTTFAPDLHSQSILRYLEILVHITRSRPGENVRALVMHVITVYLDSVDAHIVSSQLVELSALLNFEMAATRFLLSSQLTFYAILCRWAWTTQQVQILSQLRSLANSYCLHLRNAANDEIEFDTRYSALNAVRQWEAIPDLSEMLGHVFQPEHLLDILTVLYDLLNDDDEEIRGEASKFASRFMCDAKTSLVMPSISLCAAASRRKLLLHLVEDSAATRYLKIEAWRRILGHRLSVSRYRLENRMQEFLGSSSVRSRMREILDAMNDLFVEEKQNQYVDEVAEISIWAGVLNKLPTPIEVTLVDHLKAWAEDGAVCLNMVLEGEDPLSPSLLRVGEESKAANGEGTTARLSFGTTSTLNLEILIIRVVTCLQLLGKSDYAVVKQLQQNCVHLNMSEAVLSTFTWSPR